MDRVRTKYEQDAILSARAEGMTDQQIGRALDIHPSSPHGIATKTCDRCADARTFIDEVHKFD